MNRFRIIAALVLVNLGVFVATVAFLPPAGSFAWNTGNPLSYLVNSPAHWEIAWLVLLASGLSPVGIYLLITARDGNAFPK